MAPNTPLPFPAPILAEADKKRMDGIKKSIERTDLVIELGTIKRMDSLYNERRQFTKTIPKFWPVALLHHPSIAMELTNEDDVKAIQYLTDVWVNRDPIEPRVYTIEFTFSNNPYFDDRVLRKVYKFTESQGRKNEPADREGFKWSMLDFDWDKDARALPCKINWKSGKNLCRNCPKKANSSGDIDELGSFFNWFESEGDAFDIGRDIAEDIFPDAINFFNGDVDNDDDDDSDDDDDDDNDDDDHNDNSYNNNNHQSYNTSYGSGRGGQSSNAGYNTGYGTGRDNQSSNTGDNTGYGYGRDNQSSNTGYNTGYGSGRDNQSSNTGYNMGYGSGRGGQSSNTGYNTGYNSPQGGQSSNNEYTTGYGSGRGGQSSNTGYGHISQW